MLVAALRSDNPLGGAPLTCDEAAETFTVQGLGEITAAKLLDLENRRQLVWADPVTREWVLETIALRARRAAAAQAAARAAAAAAAAQAVSAQERAQAGAGTLVFEPPRTAVRPPAGIRAAQTRFEAPVGAAGGSRRVVWREPPGGASPPGAEPSGAAALTAPDAAAPGGVAMTTRRVDRRRSLKAAERRRALVPANLGTARAVAVLTLLLAVLAVVVFFVTVRGGL